MLRSVSHRRLAYNAAHPIPVVGLLTEQEVYHLCDNKVGWLHCQWQVWCDRAVAAGLQVPQPAGRVFWLATVLRCRDGRQPCRAALLCGCLAFGLGRSKLVLFA